MNTTSKLNKKIKKATKKIRKKLNKTAKTLSRFRRIRRRFRRRKRNIAMASATAFKRMFNITSQDGNSMTIKGRDLVYSIPEKLIQEFQDTSIITVIPCNPCYWLGTRISAIASGYQNYRPIKFRITYVPQCAVTQQGNVIGGTLWNTLPAVSNFQQTLRTSPGGILTQCYKSISKNVKLGNNLQFNLFRCAGEFNQESNPFIYIALAVACTENENKIIPGYFYVDYVFTFKNPIGLSHKFYNSGLSFYEDIKKDYENLSIINCSNSDTTFVGQIVDVEKNKEGQYLTEYNGTSINVKDNDVVWAFGNSNLNFQNNEELAPIIRTFKVNSLNSNYNLGNQALLPPSFIHYFADSGGVLRGICINFSDNNNIQVPSVLSNKTYEYYIAAFTYLNIDLNGYDIYVNNNQGGNHIWLIVTDTDPNIITEFEVSE